MAIRHNTLPFTHHPHRSVDIAASNDPGSHSKGLVYASFILTTTGQFTLLVLITILLRSVKEERSASVVSLLVTTLVGTVPPYILVFGDNIRNPDAVGAVCVAQAYLLAGSPTMLATTLWPMVLDTLVESRILLLEASTAKVYRILLIATPYVTLIVFFVTAAVLNQIYPNQLNHRPNDSVCALNNTPLLVASQILSVLALLMALCLEMYVLVIVLRPRRSRILRDRTSASLNPSKAVQIISFACLQAIVLITSALSNLQSPGLHIAAMFTQASVPLVTSMVTATHWTDRVVNLFKRRSGSNALQQSLSQPRPTMQLEVKVTIEKSVAISPLIIHIEGLSH
ncbi:hypothetical protein LXA43DRAFT_999468, partial [Ganoderma leucocontextum]